MIPIPLLKSEDCLNINYFISSSFLTQLKKNFAQNPYIPNHIGFFLSVLTFLVVFLIKILDNFLHSL